MLARSMSQRSQECPTSRAPRTRNDARHILFGKLRPNLGKVARPKLSGVCSTDIYPILAYNIVDRDYLAHYLLTPEAISFSSGRTSGVNLPRVSWPALSELRVPLPPLPEQRRIAAILDEADALSQRASASEALLSESLESEFRARFLASESPGPHETLDQLGRVVTGRTPPGSMNGMFGDSVPFATPGDLESGEETRRWLSETGAHTVPQVAEGSLLVCCIGATIGKVGIAVHRAAFNQQINAVEWGPRILPSYGLFAGRSLRPRIISMAPTTTLPILPKSKFAALRIPVPELEHQQEFESIAQSHQESAKQLVKRRAQAHTLFASLQHRAFRGEL